MNRPPFFTNGMYARYKRALVLDRERQQTGLAAGLAHDHSLLTVRLSASRVRIRRRPAARSARTRRPARAGARCGPVALSGPARDPPCCRRRLCSTAADGLGKCADRPGNVTRSAFPASAARASELSHRSSQVSRSIRAVFFPLGGDLRHIRLAGEQRAERLLHVLVQRIEAAVRVCQRAQRRAAGELEQRRLDRAPALLAQPRDRLARATAARSSPSGSGCAPSAAASTVAT